MLAAGVNVLPPAPENHTLQLPVPVPVVAVEVAEAPEYVPLNQPVFAVYVLLVLINDSHIPLVVKDAQLTAKLPVSSVPAVMVMLVDAVSASCKVYAPPEALNITTPNDLPALVIVFPVAVALN